MCSKLKKEAGRGPTGKWDTEPGESPAIEEPFWSSLWVRRGTRRGLDKMGRQEANMGGSNHGHASTNPHPQQSRQTSLMVFDPPQPVPALAHPLQVCSTLSHPTQPAATPSHPL